MLVFLVSRSPTALSKTLLFAPSSVCACVFLNVVDSIHKKNKSGANTWKARKGGDRCAAEKRG
jgi:hypothetical protein